MEYAKGKKFAAAFAARTKVNLQQLDAGQYDVTQLINSMIGLLIIPRQHGYTHISDDIIPPKIRGRIYSTVETNTYPEGTNIKEILRHMKNAISHSRMKFCVDMNGNEAVVRDIKIVEFRDQYKKDGQKHEFHMRITVDLLQQFLYEFSDAISKCILDETK